MKKLTASTIKGLVTLLLALSLIPMLQAQFPFFRNHSDGFDRPRNVINYGMLGEASLISLTYERVLHHRDNFLLMGKIGWGYNQEFCIIFCDPKDNLKFNGLLLQLTGNSGKNRSYFEYGLGLTHFSGAYTIDLIYPVIGYRFHPGNNGHFSFRVFSNIWPLGKFENADPVLFSPIGLSFGVAF